MPETVTHKYVIGLSVSLVNTLAESAFIELLLAVNAVIDGGTVGCRAEAVLDCTQFR